MSKKVLHIKTERVTGHELDQTATVERHTLKIMVGKSFDNFLKHINLKGYLLKEPPKVVKALEIDGKKVKEIDFTSYQTKITEALKPQTKGGDSIDYKALSEKQADEIEGLKSVNVSFEERLKAVESNQGNDQSNENDDFDDELTDSEKIRNKADELNIKYQPNIGDDTLLNRVREIEPDFSIE
jgi:hypothetical protein